MDESLGRVWIAVTNHRKFIIEADTLDQAAAKFQEKWVITQSPGN